MNFKLNYKYVILWSIFLIYSCAQSNYHSFYKEYKNEKRKEQEIAKLIKHVEGGRTFQIELENNLNDKLGNRLEIQSLNSFKYFRGDFHLDHKGYSFVPSAKGKIHCIAYLDFNKQEPFNDKKWIVKSRYKILPDLNNKITIEEIQSKNKEEDEVIVFSNYIGESLSSFKRPPELILRSYLAAKKINKNLLIHTCLLANKHPRESNFPDSKLYLVSPKGKKIVIANDREKISKLEPKKIKSFSPKSI